MRKPYYAICNQSNEFAVCWAVALQEYVVDDFKPSSAPCDVNGVAHSAFYFGRCGAKHGCNCVVDDLCYPADDVGGDYPKLRGGVEVLVALYVGGMPMESGMPVMRSSYLLAISLFVLSIISLLIGFSSILCSFLIGLTKS